MYNIFFRIFILIMMISTLGILGTKPKMHKKVLIFDSSYSIVDDEPEAEVEITMPKIKQAEVIENKTSNQVTKNTENKTVPAKKVITQKKAESQDKSKTKTVTTPKTVTKAQQTQTTVTNKPEIKTASKPTTVKQEAQKIAVQTQPKQTVLTQTEEEIAWNIWRSNLQNQIMKDVKLPYIPKGTVFKFSFDVDKYGRITNIKTWSLNSNYTPYALQYIAPVIRSYQGKDILDFPQGTQRLTTKFTGGWKISDSAVYSTPNDYNDIEKVKK